MPLTPSRPLVVVLGASGFIGSAVTRELARRQVRLRLVARKPVPVPIHRIAEVQTLTADLTKPGEMARCVAGADAVLHLVAHLGGGSGWRVEDGDDTAERVNVGLTLDLVEALRTCRSSGPPPQVVFSGTTTQVGPTDRIRIDGGEEDRPGSTYDQHKLTSERALKAATAEGVLRGTTLRLPTVYGHGPLSTARDRGVVSTMARRALADEPLTIWHDGSVLRDLVYVDDVARAFVCALDHPDGVAGGHWLVGTGHGSRIGDVFAEIAEIAAEATGRPRVPVVPVDPPERSESADFRSTVIDPAPFEEVTGWSSEVSLTEGLRRTVAALTVQVSRRTSKGVRIRAR
jgi:nucleoside-diphosphate-sugar epimerase